MKRIAKNVQYWCSHLQDEVLELDCIPKKAKGRRKGEERNGVCIWLFVCSCADKFDHPN